MWTLRPRVIFLCVYLQVPFCFPSCIISGSVADCAGRQLRAVPPLPRHITHLYLQGNRIAELDSASLRGLDELRELDLGRQLAPLAVRDGAFVGQRRLRRLVLGFNAGLRLEPRAFRGLSALRDLHLDYCSLDGSILEDGYLEPLTSLQTLDLFGNQIRRLRPSPFFANLTSLNVLNLKLNRIGRVCESDLVGFRGKHFSLLSLNSVHLREMSDDSFDWRRCGSPFRGMSFGTLDLSYTGLGEAPLRKFLRAIQGTAISHLKLSGHLGKGFSFGNLPDPDGSTFEGLRNSSVVSLDLSKNRISALQQGVFSALQDVAIVDVSQNRVNRIDGNAFRGLQGHLRMLNLSRNLLGEVYSHTFGSLTSLRVLDLSHNHIGALGYGAFRGLPLLTVLDLTGNSLRDLGFPAALPSLTHLALRDNKLGAASGVARFAPDVVHLDLRDNRLTNLEDVSLLTQNRRLRSLFFGGNAVRWCTQVRRGVPSGVELLDLHGSSLQTVWGQGRCLDLLQDLRSLRGLDLSANGLRSLPRGVFEGLGALAELDLSSNALTRLGPGALPPALKVLRLADNFLASPDPAAFPPALAALDLRGNRFRCDPDLSGFLAWLNRTDAALLSPAQELRCEFPLRVHGLPLLDYSAQEDPQASR